MAVFQVLSRTVPLAVPPKKQPRRSHQEWFTVLRFIFAVSSAGGFFTLLAFFRGSNDTVFILLPVLVYLATTQVQRFNFKIPSFTFNVLLNNTPIYLLLTFCLTLIYYSSITGIVLVIHQSPMVSRIILITTTLTWVIILDPLRVYVQRQIEQRFNLRNRGAAQAIEAFTSTLREEIDLDQLRERFIAVIQQTIQPYSVSLWTRITDKRQAQSSSTEAIIIADDDPLMAYMLLHPSALEVDRLQLDSLALQDIKLQAAEVILPLASQGELLGLLILGPHLQGEAYTTEERIILNALAPQVAPALRVAQMVQEEQEQMREHDRIEQELRMAQDIQRTFLPKVVPALSGWEIEPYYQPAREVGGDFYDFLSFDDGHLGLVIGDVTDKGIPAALVMTATRTMLRTAAQEQTSPCEVFARVNDLLYADIPARMFVTCFYALLDLKSGRLRYANAGHDLPFRCHDQGVSALWATGMPLGMMPGSTYEEHEITIAPGDSLLFYSDGLVEAHNPRREMFDTPRLKALLAERNGNGNDTSLIEDLLRELRHFTGEGWEQEDDVTLVTLRRVSEALESNALQAIPHLLQDQR